MRATHHMHPIPTAPVLPADFDGVFRFTNARKTPFSAKWNSVEYKFPPMSTTPMVIAGATPEEVQHIRKKFAREWAVEQFYASKKFAGLNKHADGTSLHGAATYTEADIAPFVQQCLEPLPLGRQEAAAVARKEVEIPLDEDGKPRTRVVGKGESLTAGGQVVA